MEYVAKTMIYEKSETKTDLVYVFDPIYDKLDDIVLAVDKEYITVYTEGKLVLEDISEIKSNTTLELDGNLIDVTYFYEGSDIMVLFETDEIEISSFENLQIENGTNGSVSIMSATKAGGGSIIEVNVGDFSQDRLVLRFDSYVVSRQISEKIGLIP
jgi:hypothetical protein